MIPKTEQKQIKLNKTSDFILPLFDRPLIRYIPYLINAYKKDPTSGVSTPYSIFILTRFSGKKDYQIFEKWMYDHPQYRGHYYLLKEEYTMFIFEVPKEFHIDYDLIIKGKYSQISERAKELILARRSPESAMPYILSKHMELRQYWEEELGESIPNDIDVWPLMTEQEETFDRVTFVREHRVEKDVLRKVGEKSVQ